MAAAPLNEVLKGGPNIAPTRGEQGCGRYVLWVDGGADPISFYPYGVGPVEKREMGGCRFAAFKRGAPQNSTSGHYAYTCRQEQYPRHSHGSHAALFVSLGMDRSVSIKTTSVYEPRALARSLSLLMSCHEDGQSSQLCSASSVGTWASCWEPSLVCPDK